MADEKRSPGRPGFGILEATYPIRAPKKLFEAMAKRAARDGISAAEAWRRAAREWLGLKPDEYQRYLEAKEDER